MNLSKYITLFLTVFFLNGCSTIKDNLSLKKKTNVDQFLVDKKDPLVLPPDFDELPLPTSLTTQEIEAEEKDENFNIKKLLNNKSKVNLADNNVQKTEPSIKKLIMKKINKN
jgi:PBP1b-binding outer membrane lipoprotein LpoB